MAQKLKLRKVMLDKEMSAKKLADETGFTTVQISRIMNGHSNGSIKWWKLAAEKLGVEMSEIME